MKYSLKYIAESSTTCKKYFTWEFPGNTLGKSQFLGNIPQNIMGKVLQFVENVSHRYLL